MDDKMKQEKWKLLSDEPKDGRILQEKKPPFPDEEKKSERSREV